MVVLDARAYQIKGSGRVSEAPLDAGAPFAVVTWFDAGIDVSTSSVGSFKDLEASCDPCQRSGNIFYALRLDGLFKSVRTGLSIRRSREWDWSALRRHRANLPSLTVRGRL